MSLNEKSEEHKLLNRELNRITDENELLKENELLSEIGLRFNKLPWRTILVYVIMGFTWIMFSDRILEVFVQDQKAYVTAQTYKGGFYVLVTAIMLFFLIKLDYSRIIKLSRAIVNKNQDLVNFSEELLAMDEELNQRIIDLNLILDELRLQKDFVDEIYDKSNTAIMIWTLDGNLLEANDYFFNIFGFNAEEITKKTWNEFIISIEGENAFLRHIKNIKENAGVKNFESKARAKNGKILDMLWNDSIITNPKTKELVIVSFGIDITAEKEKEQKIIELAFTDSLTGLSNRTVLEQNISNLIREKNPFAVYYLDIDNFRNINDIYGHQYGDCFLKDFSLKMEELFDKKNLYHWSGDEFILVDEDVTEETINARIDLLLQLSCDTWRHNHIEYHPSASIGITKFPDDGDTVGTMFKNIDLALHHSKSNGKGLAVKYNSSFLKEIEHKLHVENAIYEALVNEGFELFYQPIFKLDSKEIVGIEALLRLKNKNINISTGELIGIAEKTGQIIKIDQWVIRNTFKFIVEQLKSSEIIVSINLSAKTIDSLDLLSFLKQCLNEYELDAQNVEFEITEHSLINNISNGRNIVNGIKRLGFKIALDDFGTRYSSLNYLSQIPFDLLKIDKSYVDEILKDNKSSIVVEQIIQLSKRLGIKTVAEGIETPDQWSTLLTLECDYGQGYLFSKPIDALSLMKLLDEENVCN